MYGYDPATVVSVSLSQEEAIIRVRLAAATAGAYTIVERGFLMTDSSRAQLDGMASSYGYDPGAVIGVCIDQHESLIRYRVQQADGLSEAVQADKFGIPEPSPAPTIAATDTGQAPPDPQPAPTQASTTPTPTT
jgi:hypothetical protein